MPIIRKKYIDWNKKNKKELIGATFINGFIRKALKFEPNTDTFVFFEDNEMAGWAIIFQGPDEIAVNIFVKENYRKKGIAQKLIKKIIKEYPHIILFKWDEITNYLFLKLQKIYPKNITVKNWYPENKIEYLAFIKIKQP